MTIRGLVVTHPLISNPDRLIPQIPVTLSSGTYLSLVDTGSTISIISSNLILPHVTPNPWVYGPIVMLDGSETSPLGSLTLKATIGGRDFHHEFAVVPLHQSLLLGMDFLHGAGLMIDMKDLLWGFTDLWPKCVFPLTNSVPFNASCNNLQLLQDFESDEVCKLLKEFPDVIDAPLGKIKGYQHTIKIIEER